MNPPTPGNLVPYLHYADIEAMSDWYHRVFGFVEKRRWRGPDGTIENVDMQVGDTELWMDGAPLPAIHALADVDGNPRPLWMGVWLDDRVAVDALHEHILGQGVEPTDQPHDLPFGIRMFNVTDPEGYTWGFMCRIPPSELALEGGTP